MRACQLGGAASALALIAALTSASASETQTYTYDALGRLVAVQYAGSVNNGQAHSLCYDAAGNRTLYKSSSAGTVAGCAPTPTPTPPPSPTPSPTPTPTPAPSPSFAISDAEGYENDIYMYFTVTRSGSTATANSVSWATANSSAVAGSDYFAASGTLAFAIGETHKTFMISLIDNTFIEVTETFTVNLSSPTGGATISDGQGVGTINDDDSYCGNC